MKIYVIFYQSKYVNHRGNIVYETEILHAVKTKEEAERTIEKCEQEDTEHFYIFWWEETTLYLSENMENK